MRTFYVATLGCKINQYESQALREAWTGSGMVEVATPEEADAILVNSCAVTSGAISDLKQLVRSIHRRSPGKRVVITGCAAEVMGEELSALPGVEAVVPQRAKALLKRWPERGAAEAPASPDGRPGYQDLRITGFRRARPVLKVQDGCSHGCTYCIVPLTRGRSVSREPDEVLAEARTLLEAGFRELILSGINLRHYGRDLGGGLDFWDLVTRIEAGLAPEWAGRARLRISSLDPGQLGTKAVDVLGASRMLCPHLHLSLQSGSPATLKRMGRGHYGPGQVLDFVRDLASIWPVHGLGADLLVGFPGESDAEFEETAAFCRELPLSYAHVFPYSPRPGTPAATWPDQIAQTIKKSRAAKLRGLAASAKRRFRARLATLPEVSVIIEGTDPARGVCEFYVECEFTRTPAAGLKALVKAKPTAATGSGLAVVPGPDGDAV